MKIHSIELKDVGGIPYLKLENLNSKMNIICGENGVGKTNILDAIAASFSQFDKNHVRKRAGSDKAIITIKHDKKVLQIFMWILQTLNRMSLTIFFLTIKTMKKTNI